MSTTIDPAEVDIDIEETYDYDGDLEADTVRLTMREGQHSLYLRVDGEIVDSFCLLGLADKLGHV
jgi:hypothetical protein